MDRDVGADTESALFVTRGNWVLTIVNTTVKLILLFLTRLYSRDHWQVLSDRTWPFFSIPQTNDHATVFNFYLKQALKFTSMITVSRTLQQCARSPARSAARKKPGKKI